MTLQPCLVCGEPSPGPRCPGHQLRSQRNRNHVHANPTRWKRLSARVRRVQPWCASCGRTDDLTVDHVIPVAVRPDLAYSIDNLTTLCRRCNGAKGDAMPTPAVVAAVEAAVAARKTRGVTPRAASLPPAQLAKFVSHTASQFTPLRQNGASRCEQPLPRPRGRGWPCSPLRGELVSGATKAGPKAPVTADPLDFTGWPTDRAARRERFIRRYLTIPRGEGAGDPFRLRPWQEGIVRGAFAPGVRTALVSLPRANGKTMIAAALAVAELWVGPPSAEVLVVASDQRQANITLRYAKRMIELNPELADRCMTYADRLVVPHNDATLTPLPAEPGALHGHDPSLLIVDELHVVTEAVWEAVTSMSGKRPESLTLAISTPSTSPDCVMWSLVEHGREGTDPAFYLREFAAPNGCATDDKAAWKLGNPALGDFLAEDGLEAVRKTTREPVFRQLRLGQWVSGAESWLPWGAWAECADPARLVADGERVALAFDGSASGDSTALIGCTVGPDPHLFVLGLWENPGDPRWRVPRGEVDAAVDVAFDTYDVAELACDPWGWRSEIEAWAKRHGEKHVLEWNTAHGGRMAPATDRLYQAVATKAVTHDGDPKMAAHFAHAVAKRTPMGDLISKDKRGSPRKIDAAVAGIVALDRAAFHAQQKTKRRTRSFA